MAWGVEALGVGEDVYVRNGLVFATREEAREWALGLMLRWTGCRDARPVEVDEPVGYVFDPETSKAVRIE